MVYLHLATTAAGVSPTVAPSATSSWHWEKSRSAINQSEARVVSIREGGDGFGLNGGGTNAEESGGASHQEVPWRGSGSRR